MAHRQEFNPYLVNMVVLDEASTAQYGTEYYILQNKYFLDCVCVCVCVCVHAVVHLKHSRFIKGERERESECVCVCVC
jgi:hypothetical protein